MKKKKMMMMMIPKEDLFERGIFLAERRRGMMASVWPGLHGPHPPITGVDGPGSAKPCNWHFLPESLGNWRSTRK
jgi:hypothetical protein